MAHPTLLLTEDDGNLAAVLSNFLKNHGFDVLVAGSSQEALETLRRKAIDLALFDIQLPDFDGLTLLRHIREDGSELPVIVITGHINRDNHLNSFKNGADIFHPKPIDFDLLLSQIGRLLEKIEPDSLLEVPNIGLKFDTRSRKLAYKDKVVLLSRSEGLVFEKLLRTSDMLLLNSEFTTVSGEPMLRKTRDSLASRLRKRLRELGVPLKLVNLRGTGYQLQEE